MLIKSLLISDRNWKTEFLFISGFWAGNPIEVGKDPFTPYTRELGNLCPEGIFLSYSIFSIFFWTRLTFFLLSFFFFFLAVRQPSLNKFYLECIQKARLFAYRSFHSLVTLQHLST